MYRRYKKNPSEVDPSWRAFFSGTELGEAFASPNTLDFQVLRLIEAYRRYGWKKVRFDPFTEELPEVPELATERFGFPSSDISVKTFGLLPSGESSLSSLIEALENRYCRGIGFDWSGVDEEVAGKIRSYIEKNRYELSKEETIRILDGVMQAELFENFLHRKYPGQTRFSLEGGETLIPVLRYLCEYFSERGGEEIVLGMAHRGRLNVLTHVLDKSYDEVFSDFEGEEASEEGDVKYHRGAEARITTRNGKELRFSIPYNPSHLESIDPVVEGIVRARQEEDLSKSPDRIMAVLVHGDASLSGQGVIYETLQLHGLPGYATLGTVHIVFNNRIGYTTLPQEGRSTSYCTDIAKAFGAPVLRVSAESPKDCVEAIFWAVGIRQMFAVDVFLDLHCYRKYGHNEGDEPTFTQPLEYEAIRKKESIRKVFEQSLIRSGMVTEEEIQKKEQDFSDRLTSLLQKPASSKHRKESIGEMPVASVPKISLETLQTVVSDLSSVPENFMLHPKLRKILDSRRDKQRIDWALAEHLAFASLLIEGKNVRLSGQDVARGTFSQRHAVWIDQKRGTSYIPLRHLSGGKGRFSVYNSPLSEFAVMGFDFGYASASPSTLVLWEAQYGDFANGAQVIIDQYLAAGESKWRQQSGIVLLLPHGYEGKGPEHSSARIERFLQLCAENNLIVANPITPAGLFHLLRRQAYLEKKKPLILFTPKGLLRHAECTSLLFDLAEGTFSPYTLDIVSETKIETLLICSGKIFYDLKEERRQRNEETYGILALEQLYPFPDKELSRLLERYPGNLRRVWVQEEPMNTGPADYIQKMWNARLPGYPLAGSVGRKESASPAAGSYSVHKAEQKQLMNAIFTSEKNL